MNAVTLPTFLIRAFALMAASIGIHANSLIAQVAPARTLITNVRIFDGKSAALSGAMNVLIEGNLIKEISATAIAPAAGTTVVDGGGRTLMPGLIDAHTHIMFETLTQEQVIFGDIGFLNIVATRNAEWLLMRGFTSIRDLGGPCFGLKMSIDMGIVPGPRIWPCGAFISQTGGHGDFRFPNELPSPPGSYSYAERIGASAIADDADAVRKRAREQLALGASQLKLMAGGGVGSSYDPLDVTQYTVPELRAAVEAAENWGTYVTVHAYTPRAIRQALEAGVKCIDHGNLIDDATAKLMAEKGAWWSEQPFTDDRPSAFADGTPKRLKQLEMYSGTDNAYALAKKYKIKMAWGTDILYSAENAANRGQMLTKMVRWFTPAEALRMATADNAELLALSGPRNPYPGKLGVVEEGALADLILVDGDPLSDLEVLGDPLKTVVLVMKDGKIYKSSLP